MDCERRVTISGPAEQFSKCEGRSIRFEVRLRGGGGGCGVVDFKNGLPGADPIFFNTVTNLSRLIRLESLLKSSLN